MTAYYIHISKSLVKELLADDSMCPQGWRLVCRTGEVFHDTEEWLIDDINALPEYDGKLLDLLFTRTMKNPRATLTSYEILGDPVYGNKH